MLTPEQTRDLVKHFGGQRAAARAIGVSQSTVWLWLNPEVVRERRVAYDQRRYDKLSTIQYHAHLLRNRRRRALQSMAKRRENRGAL